MSMKPREAFYISPNENDINAVAHGRHAEGLKFCRWPYCYHNPVKVAHSASFMYVEATAYIPHVTKCFYDEYESAIPMFKRQALNLWFLNQRPWLLQSLYSFRRWSKHIGWGQGPYSVTFTIRSLASIERWHESVRVRSAKAAMWDTLRLSGLFVTQTRSSTSLTKRVDHSLPVVF